MNLTIEVLESIEAPLMSTGEGFAAIGGAFLIGIGIGILVT